jgi:hypothetical protein
MKNLTASEVSRLRELLPKVEAAHLFPRDQIEALRSILELHEDFGDEIRALVERERTSRLWAKARVQMFRAAQWFIVTATGFITAWIAFSNWLNGR